MTPNELLLWLSARREGSWQQFRAAVETLDLAGSGDEPEDALLPLHQRVRLNLERLGHVEFDAAECENGWRVVPPSLAVCQHAEGVTAVLCGARTPGLLKRIEDSANGLSFERTPHPDCPDVIRVRAAASEPFAALASRENLLFAPDSPVALLSNIPPVDAFGGWRREPLPSTGKEWNIRKFVIEKRTIEWRAVTLQEANGPGVQGLFRFTLYQRPKYFLRDGHTTVTLPGAIGKYRVMLGRQRRYLKYDRAERRLSLPAIVRPPLLTERALILCSGFPPALTSAPGKRPVLSYRDIPEEVAGMAAEVLRQDFA